MFRVESYRGSKGHEVRLGCRNLLCWDTYAIVDSDRKGRPCQEVSSLCEEQGS